MNSDLYRESFVGKIIDLLNNAATIHGDFNTLKIINRYSRLDSLTIICALISAVLGFIVLTGYAFGLKDLSSLGKDFIPMAEETASLFMISGITLALLTMRDKSKTSRYLMSGCSVFIGIIALFGIIDFSTSYSSNLSDFIGSSMTLKVGIRTGQMALPTAISFLLTCISILLIPTKVKKYSVIFSSITLFVGYIIVIGYAYGVPFLYGGSDIPMAWTTAFGFIVTSSGLLFAAGRETPPVSYFIGDSTRAKLMRNILPFMFLVISGHDFLDTFINKSVYSSSALTNSIVDIIVLILTGAIIWKLSHAMGNSIDSNIAERKLAEDKLIRSEKELKRTQEITHIGSWYLDLATNEVVWTEELYKMYGFDPKLPPPPYTEHQKLFTPESWTLLSSSLANTAKTGIPYELELETVRDEGHNGWMWVRGEMVKDKHGKTIGIWGAAQDITERKLIEEALRKSEADLSITLHSIGDGVISTDKEGRIVRMNSVAEQLTGWRLATAIGRPLSDVFCIINSESREQIPSPIKRVLEHGEKVELSNHTLLISKDGREYQIADSASPIKTLGGKISGVVLVFSDVTEQYARQKQIKESEARYENLIRNLKAGIVVHAPDTSIISNNHMAEELLGLSNDQMRGKVAIDPAWKFVNEDYSTLPVEDFPVNRVRKLQGPIQNQILGINRPIKNDLVWVIVNGFPLLNSNGDITEIVISFLDITKRKQVEEALVKSEERLRSVFTGMSEGFSVQDVICDENGKPCDLRFVDANPAFERQTGLKNSETLGHTLLELFPTSEPYWIERYGHVGLTGEPTHFEAMFGPLNIYYSVSAFQTKPGQFGVMFTDINERRIAAETLRTSEEKFRNLAESMPQIVWITRSDGWNIYFNQQWVGYTGMSLEESYGHGWNKPFHPDDQKRAWDAWQNAVNNGATYSLECRLRRADGIYKWWLIRGVPIKDEQGNILQWFGTCTDIDDYKIAEAKIREKDIQFRKLSSNLPDLIFQFTRRPDGSYCVPIASEGIKNIFGCSPEDVIDDFTPIGRVLYPEDVERVINDIEYSAKHLTYFTCEFRVQIPGKPVQWIYSRSSPEKLPDGSITWYGFNANITERKNAELELEKHRNHLEDMVKMRTEELNKVNKDLQVEIEKQKEYECKLKQSLEAEKELNEMKSRFISTASHEFRTPLTSVLLSSGLIKRNLNKWDDVKKSAHLDKIDNAVHYLTNLIDDVLTINKTENGKLDFAPQFIDLKSVAENCTVESGSISESHDIQLVYTAASDSYFLDQKLIRFIIDNLMSNAIKYSPDGGKVCLSISSAENQVLIKVSDEGIGIPSEEIERIYDSFYRTKNAEDMPGTGLGLTIVKRAVDLHKGRIEVESELGKGTTFTVRIPINS